MAETRSFSAAARVLGVGQPTISRRVAELEARLGCALFSRGRRGAELTEQGERLVPAAEQMARWAGEFDRLARGAEEAPEGRVRLAAPPALAVDYLAPLAAVVRQRWPRIRLEILASIDHVDLSRGTADLAIRTRAPHEPGLKSVARMDVSLGVFASRDYAERLSQPAAIADLDWITWAFPYEHVAPRPMLERAIPGFTPAFASDDYLVQRSAVRAGLGAMILERPTSLDVPFVRESSFELVEIDVGFELPQGELHLVCANSMRFVPRVRAMIELLGEMLGGEGAGAR